MNTETLVPVYTAFGGIILGAIAGFFPTYLVERIKRREEIEAVTSAIVTEIRVTLRLVAMRKYIESIEELLQALRAGRMATSSFQVMVPEDYCPIFKSHLDKVGLLPSSIRDEVVTFYQLLEAVIADIRPGGLIASSQCGEKEFEQLYQIASEALRIGRLISGDES